ncbi:conserved hypothetical protein [Agrobacterium tomkonis CFBP 6623]|uniref:Uncharacterized protein n=1 Tax=Agrobacterium tomkonis CFBP 6623 TaxID=1183432 RepID=A0A1S7SA91_9HYPH|nr:conserved hypothetical protein [Agrobacterium tomkonis CFBP 6623]
MQMLELHMATIGELINHPQHTVHFKPLGNRKLSKHSITRKQSPTPSLR